MGEVKSIIHAPGGIERNRMEVVINTCYGGFGLSGYAKNLMEMSGGDPEDYERDDEHLIKTVRSLGKNSWGEHAELRIVELPHNPIGYEIAEHDGVERVFPVYSPAILDTTRPHWEHDCDSCVFLGGVVVNGERTDAYACIKTGENRNMDSVISRFGNDGHAYSSMHPGFRCSPGSAASFSLYLKHLGYDGLSGNGTRVHLKDGQTIRL